MKQDTLEGKAKTKNGVKRLCFSIVCILLEVIFIITIVTRLNEYAEIINLFTRILSGILVLGLYASDKTSSMKMPWVILILIFPIMGVGLYLLIGLNGGTHKMRERYTEIDSKLLPMLPDNQECLSRIKETIPKAGNIASYIQRNSQYPIYQNTDIVYFDEAVTGLEAQLKDLKKAQKFIFMEYHAIEDAEAWHKIQDVLEERVKAGVEVRVFYDDEVSILELIKNSLGKDGYLITVCQNADDVDIKKLHFYDLILLDVMMPGTDGFEFCKQIRNMVDCPILFLTAKTLEEDILFGLGIGADDYITKPFHIQELRARVAAHLRREKREHHSTLSFEPDIRFDLSAKVLYVSEQPVPLTKSEYSICEYLAKNRGQVFTKEQIYEAVFGFDGIGDNSTISTHIKNIRAKLEHFKISPISTVWGIGYKWE